MLGHQAFHSPYFNATSNKLFFFKFNNLFSPQNKEQATAKVDSQQFCNLQAVSPFFATLSLSTHGSACFTCANQSSRPSLEMSTTWNL
jgi:hypothetical protein